MIPIIVMMMMKSIWKTISPRNTPIKLNTMKIIDTNEGFVFAMLITTNGITAAAIRPVAEFTPNPKPLFEEM